MKGNLPQIILGVVTLLILYMWWKGSKIPMPQEITQDSIVSAPVDTTRPIISNRRVRQEDSTVVFTDNKPLATPQTTNIPKPLSQEEKDARYIASRVEYQKDILAMSILDIDDHAGYEYPNGYLVLIKVLDVMYWRKLTPQRIKIHIEDKLYNRVDTVILKVSSETQLFERKHNEVWYSWDFKTNPPTLKVAGQNLIPKWYK